jgi:GT2 family glycosyltransferase
MSLHLIPIIIVNWNGINDTLECLHSVLQQSYTNYHIFLVDNGSNGDDVEILKERFLVHPKVSLVLNKENIGFARANNNVLKQIIERQAEIEYVALLNNDAVAEPDWLQNLVGSAERNRAGMVASKMVNYFDRDYMDNAGHEMLNTGEILPIGHGERIEDYGEPFDNIGACAGAALYSVDMLRTVGLFDEFFETGYEDAELGLRAFVLGYRTSYEPTAVVYHKMQQSIRKIMNCDYLTKIQTNILYSYLKLMPTEVLLINLPWLIFKYLCVMIIDILLIRRNYLRMVLYSIYELTRNWRIVLIARRRFLSTYKTIGTMSILRKQKFFFLFDLERFFKLVAMR